MKRSPLVHEAGMSDFHIIHPISTVIFVVIWLLKVVKCKLGKLMVSHQANIAAAQVTLVIIMSTEKPPEIQFTF